MLKRTLALVLAILTLTSMLCSCSSKLGDDYYDYDLSEYISVNELNFTVTREKLNSEMLKSFQSYASSAATIKTYGGSSSNALSAEGITVENGDTANIDYVGKLNGVAFSGGTASGYDLVIGSGKFIDGFESGLVGAKVGETRDLNLKFPDSYHSSDLAGKSVVFTVKVNYVKRYSYPEFTEENLQKYGKITMAELEKKTLGTLVYDNLYSGATVIKYPEEELNDIVEKYKTMYTAQATKYGMTLSQYISAAYQMTEQQFNDSLLGQIKPILKRDLITYYILDKYPELMLEESDYDTQAQLIYNELKAGGEYSGTFESFKASYDEFDIITVIYSRRVIEFLGTQGIILDSK